MTPQHRWVRQAVTAGGREAGPAGTALLVAGAALLGGSAAIHLHLWLTGYRHIPTIGPLFLLQVVAGWALALLVLATRRVWAALLAAGFALSTMAGFVLSATVGLFGFSDSWSSAWAGTAFAVEAAAVVVLVAGAAQCVRRQSPGRSGIPDRAAAGG